MSVVSSTKLRSTRSEVLGHDLFESTGENNPMSASIHQTETYTLSRSDSAEAARLLTGMVSSPDFSLNLELATNTEGAQGDILRVDSTLGLRMMSSGDLIMRVGSDSGKMTLITDGAALNDTKPHEIGIELADGWLQLFVDGELATRTVFEGNLADAGEMGEFSPFDGLLSAISLTADFSDVDLDSISVSETYVCTINIEGNSQTILKYNAGDSFTAITDGQEIEIGSGRQLSAKGIEIKAANNKLNVDFEHFNKLYSGGDITIDFGVEAASLASRGEIFRMAGLIAGVTDDGELRIRAAEQDDRTSFATSGAQLNDTGEHQVAIRISDSKIQVNVDGQIVGEWAFSGLSSGSNGDLTFGSRKSGGNFEGYVTNFSISHDHEDYGNAFLKPLEQQSQDDVIVDDSFEEVVDEQEIEIDEDGAVVVSPSVDVVQDELEAKQPITETPTFPEAPEAIETPDLPKAPEWPESAVLVSGMDELMEVLANAKGGETILLEGGEYGKFGLRNANGLDFRFDSSVTIASADPNNPAVFSEVSVNEARNLTFDGILFDYTYQSGDSKYLQPFVFANSEKITIRNSDFDGDDAFGVSEIDDGHGWAKGLSIRKSTDIVIEDTAFHGFLKGLGVGRSENVVIRNNDIYDMRVDGMTFVAVNGVLIEGNHIHDYSRALDASDHADMIQFWTTGTDIPSENVVIRGNTLDIGAGNHTQSIFIRNQEVDQGKAGAEMYYQNFLIENNVIVNGHSHGITVGETDGLVIRNNTVVHADGAEVDGQDFIAEFPRINVSPDSVNVSISQNIVSKINGYLNQSDWAVENNLLAQDLDLTAPNHYSEIFVASSLQPAEDGGHHFVLSPNLANGDIQIGADLTQTGGLNGLMPQFDIFSPKGNDSMLVFDGSHSLFNGEPLPEGTEYTWTFHDKSTVEGPMAVFGYDMAGHYPVTLDINMPNGTSASLSYVFQSLGSEVLRYKAGESFIAIEDGLEIEIGGGDQFSADGFEIRGHSNNLSVGFEHFSQLYSSDDVAIDFGLDAASLASSGEIFRMAGLIAGVTDDGELQIRAAGLDGDVSFATSGARLNDTDEHQVSIRISGNGIQVGVDGRKVGETDFSGLSAGSKSDLVFGSRSDNNFEGHVTAFAVNRDWDDYEGAFLKALEINSIDDIIPML